MLARVAESLYWIGRNLERFEHGSRYMKVQYFSTLNAPMSQNKDFALRSILFISGLDIQIQGDFTEDVVWQKVIFDSANENSLLSLSRNVRENARGIRNSISEEFWGAINRWYLENQKVEYRDFSTDQLFSLIEDNDAQIALIKSRLHHTILHDDIWNFISLGIYIERALQVMRITRSKISDGVILSNNGENQVILQYQLTTLLQCLEAFDMHKKQYKGLRSKESIYELLLTQDKFPRSLHYALSKIKRHLAGISVHPVGYDQIIADLESFTTEDLVFKDFSDEDAIISVIDNGYKTLNSLHSKIHELYFQ